MGLGVSENLILTMLNTSYSPWPCFSDEEIDAVRSVLRSNRVNYWTGTEAREFETEFARFVGCNHAIALANGTLALDVALKFLIEPGDEVIVTPRTFIASVSSVVTAGGVPVFADIDRNTQALNADTIEEALTDKTRAIILVHLAGQPADIAPIMTLANKHGLKVIEDCAQAHGARYKGRSVGSIGHVGAWSFCQDKIMTTAGEGGMITTNDEDLWKKMWAYKDHGKSWDAVYNKEHPPGYRWLHESFGTNWRMTEVQGAVGRIQLRKMQHWQSSRYRNMLKIWDACRGIPWLRVPDELPDCVHAAYKTYVFIRPELLPVGWDRDSVLQALNDHGVPAYSGSCSEVYLEKAFDGTGFRPRERLAVAKELGETSIMFLCHPTLTDHEILQMCDGVAKVSLRVAN